VIVVCRLKTRNKKQTRLMEMDGHEEEIEDIEIDESLAKQVANGLDYFWSQNELCYDENLKVVRSDRPRVRPKYSYDYIKRDKKDVEGN
jgi:hypothetical protein